MFVVAPVCTYSGSYYMASSFLLARMLVLVPVVVHVSGAACLGSLGNFGSSPGAECTNLRRLRSSQQTSIPGILFPSNLEIPTAHSTPPFLVPDRGLGSARFSVSLRRPSRLELMSSCLFGKPRTPLEIYGRSLPDDADAAGRRTTSRV